MDFVRPTDVDAVLKQGGGKEVVATFVRTTAAAAYWAKRGPRDFATVHAMAKRDPGGRQECARAAGERAAVAVGALKVASDVHRAYGSVCEIAADFRTLARVLGQQAPAPLKPTFHAVYGPMTERYDAMALEARAQLAQTGPAYAHAHDVARCSLDEAVSALLWLCILELELEPASVAVASPQ